MIPIVVAPPALIFAGGASCSWLPGYPAGRACRLPARARYFWTSSEELIDYHGKHIPYSLLDAPKGVLYIRIIQRREGDDGMNRTGLFRAAGILKAILSREECLEDVAQLISDRCQCLHQQVPGLPQ